MNPICYLCDEDITEDDNHTYQDNEIVHTNCLTIENEALTAMVNDISADVLMSLT